MKLFVCGVKKRTVAKLCMYLYIITMVKISFLDCQNEFNILLCAPPFVSQIIICIELELPYERINDMRYTDWAISTPLMLLVLCMVLGMENKHVVNFWVFMLILLFST